MRGIEGSPSICLDSLIDTSSFDQIDVEIQSYMDLIGDGINRLHRVEYRTHALYYGDDGQLVEEFYKDIPEVQEWWVRAEENILFKYGRALLLRRPNNFWEKHLPEACETLPVAKHFKSLMAFANSLPLEGIGRIILFVTPPEVSGLVHSDAISKDTPCESEFIWFTPNGKRFYIVDDATNTRHYVQGRCAFFNTADYHGVEVSDRISVSCRVDGRFTPEFKSMIGLSDHPTW